MTTQFDRTLTGWRFVQILFNDTLQEIAAREFKDASRWVDLVNINGLAPPYLTGDPTVAGPKVKLFGQMLLVPAGSPQVTTATDADAVFGTDIAFDNQGNLQLANGDLDIVSGRDNLVQAIVDVIQTDKGELLFHLDYGCSVRKLLGQANGPTSGLLGAEFVKAAVAADRRVQSVPAATAQSTGNALEITATVVPISGGPVKVAVP